MTGKNYFSRMNRSSKVNAKVAVAISIAAGITAYAIIISFAASDSVVVDSESTSVVSPATTVSDSQASGGSAIQFTVAAGGDLTCGQTEIQKLVDSVSQDNIEANLRSLVQDDSQPTPNESISRHVSSDGNQIKVDWMKQKLTEYGLQNVDQPFSSGGYDLENIVGRLNGTDTNTLYGIGGHIDSTSGDASNLAPGADDNGSGVVAVMEAARVLAGYQGCLTKTIDFVGFNDEEEGFRGSQVYIEELGNKTFNGMFNIDMVGHGPDGACIQNFYNSSRDQPLAQKLQDMNTKYGVNLDMSMDTYSANDQDGANFWDAGLPALFEFECSETPHYHETTDTTQYINFDQITQLTKVLVAGLAELASE